MIGFGALDGVAGVANIDKMNALRYTAVLLIQRRYNTH